MIETKLSEAALTIHSPWYLKDVQFDVVEGKDHSTVEDFVVSPESHNGDRNQIKDVSCDMSPAFIKGVKEYLPEDTITFDRFHILTVNQKETLEELQLSKPNLKSIRALHIRENFQEIYKALSEEEFEILLKKWYFWTTHGRLVPIIKAAKARGFKTFRNFRIVVFY